MASRDAFLDQPRRIVAAVLVVAAVVGSFGLAYAFADVLFSLFVGIVLATSLKPLIDALQQCGVRQSTAVLAVYACVTLLLLVVILAGVPPVIHRARELANEFLRASEQVRQWLANAGDVFWANAARRLMAGFSVGHIAEPEQSLATFGRTASYLAILARGLLAGCVVVLLAFYWSLQGDRTIRWMLLLVPLANRESVREAISEIEGKVGAYVRGQGLVCLAMATMAAVVYGMLGLRSAVVLALVAGLLEVMPVLGPVLGAIPPLGVALFTDPGQVKWVLLAAFLMQQIESYLIVPRIMDKSVGVHPMVTLLAIAAFGSLLGIGGAILAIPLAAIVQALLNRCLLRPAAVEAVKPGGRDALSVLQYDSQKLLSDIRLRDKAELATSAIGHRAEAIEAIARDFDKRLKEIEGSSIAERDL